MGTVARNGLIELILLLLWCFGVNCRDVAGANRHGF